MKKKLLLIDDEDLVREALAEHLYDEGYEVHQAENGQLGLTRFHELNPEVIILDLSMPVMGGVDFLKELDLESRHRRSVIVLTGYGKDEDVETCYSLGIHTFLRKPVNLFELSGAVHRAFDLLSYGQRLKQEVEEKEQALQQLNTAHEKLEEQHHLLRQTFDGMAEGVLILDELFRVRSMSRKAAEKLGLAERDALGKGMAAILGATAAGSSGQLTRHIHKKLFSQEFRTEILCPSGAILQVSMTVLPLSEKGGGWLVLFRDRRDEERALMNSAGGHLFGEMVSGHPKMNEIFNFIDKVASSKAAVLIQGESGTGKELVAKELHKRSKRAQGPFQAVNCAAISPNLMESEFFGHERGAFTGALQSRQGRFEMANGGTLFLDEIGEIPLELQPKLLRALQEQTFEKVGGNRVISVNVRVVAATNKDLAKMVQNNQFREDLYYRLRVLPILLPPLRERIQDIPLLVQRFITLFNQREDRQVSHLSQKAMQHLMERNWPGNIRELYHALEYAFAVSSGNILNTEDFPPESQQDLPEEPMLDTPQNEREFILQALEKANYHKGKASALLGMDRSTLYRKRKKYGI